MKPGRLLVAAVVLAALGGALWWSNRDEKAKEGKPAADAPPEIVAIKPDAVKEIDIKRRDGETTSVRFNDKGKWEITSPKPLAADSTSVAQLTNALSKLTSDRMVDANATDLAGYGLMPPLLEVDVATKDGKTTQLQIGEATPTGNNVYAKLGGDPRLFTMPNNNKATFDKTAKDLREKHLLAFTGGKLEGVGLTLPGKNGPQTIEFSRSGETDWEIEKPKKMRADGAPVDDIISKLKLTEMDVNSTPEDLKKAAAAFASAPLVGIVKVIDSTATQTLEVRKIKDDYYARSSAIDGVYKIGKDLGDALAKPADDYRNKKLFDFGFSDPNRIVVQDGGRTATYEKIKDKWMSGGKEMDPTSMQAFIDRLRDLSASKFADMAPAKPAISLNVASNDGKKNETVNIGPAAAGPDYLAQRPGEDGFYQIDANVVRELRGAAADVKEVQAKKK